jgi:hypothetical protein
MSLPDVVFAATADPATITAAVRQHGVALVRRALPAAGMVMLGSTVAAFYARPMEAERREWIMLNGLSGPNLDTHLPTLFAVLASSIAGRVASCYLGSDAVVPLNHLLFRLRDRTVSELAKGSAHNFHQDHDLVPAIFPLNMWLPLSVVDAECEGLSFAFPHSRKVYKLPLPIDEHLALDGGKVWTPAMEPGDLLIFHRYTIHGGFFEPRPKTRLSVEMRLGGALDAVGYSEPLGRL